MKRGFISIGIVVLCLLCFSANNSSLVSLSHSRNGFELTSSGESIFLTDSTTSWIDTTWVTTCYTDSFLWNDHYYNESGLYVDSLSDATIAHLLLTILPPQSDTIIVHGTLCENSGYYIPNYGTVYTTGTYTTRHINDNGCDSLIVHEIDYAQVSDTIIYDTICAGQSDYTKYGFNISNPEAQMYRRYGGYVSGCSFYYILLLSERATTEINISATINAGERFTEHGFDEYQAGNYTMRLADDAGCDSLLNLSLKLNSDNDTLFNISVLTTPSMCQSDGSIFITLSGESVSGLSQISYEIYGNGNTYHGVSNLFNNLPSGIYTVVVNAVYQGIIITKSIIATIGGSYIIPQASKVVGSSYENLGTRHTFHCQATGRIQVKITDGTFPYYIEIFKEGVYIRTDTIENYHYYGSYEGAFDYQYYYSIDSLDAGTYSLKITDGCGYTLPQITETIREVDNDYWCPSMNSSWSIKGGSLIIVPFSLMNYSADTYKYYQDHSNGYSEWWEYAYSFDGGPMSDWQTVPRDGMVYDTLKNSSGYCDIWDKSYTIMIRVKGCSEIACSSTIYISRPSFYTSTSVSSDGCSKYWYIHGSGDEYYSTPLYFSVIDSMSGSFLVQDSMITSRSWWWYLYDYEPYENQSLHFILRDAHH